MGKGRDEKTDPGANFQFPPNPFPSRDELPILHTAPAPPSVAAVFEFEILHPKIVTRNSNTGPTWTYDPLF